MKISAAIVIIRTASETKALAFTAVNDLRVQDPIDPSLGDFELFGTSVVVGFCLSVWMSFRMHGRPVVGFWLAVCARCDLGDQSHRATCSDKRGTPQGGSALPRQEGLSATGLVSRVGVVVSGA
jgi:hypothetical protein